MEEKFFDQLLTHAEHAPWITVFGVLFFTGYKFRNQIWTGLNELIDKYFLFKNPTNQIHGEEITPTPESVQSELEELKRQIDHFREQYETVKNHPLIKQYIILESHKSKMFFNEIGITIEMNPEVRPAIQDNLEEYLNALVELVKKINYPSRKLTIIFDRVRMMNSLSIAILSNLVTKIGKENGIHLQLIFPKISSANKSIATFRNNIKKILSIQNIDSAVSIKSVED